VSYFNEFRHNSEPDDGLTPRMRALQMDLDSALRQIASLFNRPRITLIVRNEDVNDGDVVLTDDDPERAIAALRRLDEV
jgi:hypothetical protein